MNNTFDFDTPIGEVRLMIPDYKNPAKLCYDDVHIAAFLRLEDGNSKNAAALALETMSSDLARKLKYIETNALKVDGSKVADVILKRAKMLREQTAVVVEEVEDEDEWEFITSHYDCEVL